MTSGRRRFAAALAALVGLTLTVAIVAVAALVAAAAFGVSIDVSRWRDAAAQRAAAALGRPVTLQGALELRLGRELELRAGGVQIMNPPGFAAQEFLTIGTASARIDVLDALRSRWRLRNIEASDVVLRLERGVDGRGNWSLPPRSDPVAAPATIDIDRFTLRGLALHYHDARSATRRFVGLDELSGNAGRNDRLRLAASGRVDAQRPYTVKLEGGPLRLLQDDAEPWPFTLDIDARGAALHANGSLDTRSGRAGFGFTARVDDLETMGRLVGAKLPPWGPAALQGTVAAAADAVELTSFRGRLGASEMSGQLALAFGGVRPRLSGRLDAEALDLHPFLAKDQGTKGGTLDYDALTQQTLSLRNLLPLDLAVDMKVGRWLGLPVEIRDASFALHADTQGLRVPMRLSIASVPFSGDLQFDTATPTAALALQLVANDAALGDLAHDLAQRAGVEGTFGRLGLRIGGRGDTLGSLVRDLELSLSVAAAKVRVAPLAGGRPIAFTLDTLELALRRGERLRGQARGSLLGERASLSIRGGTVADMLHERAMPIELELALPQARLRVEATLPHAEPLREAALAFDFQARRSGDLARWLGVAPESDLAVALRGRVRSAEDAWFVERASLKLGRSEMVIDARRTLSDGRPLIKASVRSPLIDVQELSTLRADPGTSTSIGTATVVRAGTGARPSARLDAPIFPAAAALADADIDLHLQRVWLGRAELADLALDARIREGRLWPSPVTGKLAGAAFTAQIEFDPRGALPLASLDLATGAIDVGVLLRQLGVAEDIDGRAEALNVKLAGRGNSLRELAQHSALEARFVGGRISVLGAAQRAVAEIGVNEASIGAMPGDPIRVRLDGTLDQTPVKIDVRSGSLADFTRDASRLPFAMVAQAAGTRLSLEGEVALPLGRDAQLVLEMSGERLDTLSALAQVELPPWGPWSLRGPIRMTPTGYEVQGLRVEVGQSRLGGSGHLDISGPRPRLDVQVTAPSIQLDDFPVPQRLVDASAPPGRGDGLRVSASRLAGRTDTLLSAAFLRRLDADIDVKAKEVLSGADRLADGALHLQLKEGRLHLDPAVVNLPGGTMRLSMSYDLKESEVDFAVSAYVERFDYGIIARRLRRADDLKGLFSLNLKLVGKAPSLDAIMKNADGKLDIAVWPTDLRSGVFNLWSVNLILTLLPLIDPGGHAQVNCIVGRFDLDDGKLSDDKIVIDTTALRIRGAGHANLATEELAFVFRPRAKGFGLFRLQTPLRVTGTLTDQRFGFTQRDVVESVLRLIASPILVPIEHLTQGPLPRDGADLCTDPMRALGG